MKQAIGYCRVSTREQGMSRNGLESQRSEIVDFCADEGYTLIEIAEEVASGSADTTGRPTLARCIATARRLKCALVVAKLDRFSRSVAFVSASMEAFKADRVVFFSAELGTDVDPFLMHLYASIAEKERIVIGKRTKAGLAAAKARGVVMGNRTNHAHAVALGGATLIRQANTFASTMKPLIQPLRQRGMSLRDVADHLNLYGTPTARGGKWSAMSVMNIEKRWQVA